MTLVDRVLPVSRFPSTRGSERTVGVAEQQAAQYMAKGGIGHKTEVRDNYRTPSRARKPCIPGDVLRR